MMRIKLETAVTLADILARLAISRIPAPDSRRILLEDYAALDKITGLTIATINLLMENNIVEL